jgi:hypothetical protein
MKRIKLPHFELQVHGNHGTIVSDLYEPSPRCDLIADPARAEFHAAIDGMKAIILAAACAGVAVRGKAFKRAIRKAVAAIRDEFREDE